MNRIQPPVAAIYERRASSDFAALRAPMRRNVILITNTKIQTNEIF